MKQHRSGKAEFQERVKKMLNEKRVLIVFAVVEFIVIALVVYTMQTSKF